MRSQLFQLSDEQTNRQTDGTKNMTSFGGGNKESLGVVWRERGGRPLPTFFQRGDDAPHYFTKSYGKEGSKYHLWYNCV